MRKIKHPLRLDLYYRYSVFVYDGRPTEKNSSRILVAHASTDYYRVEMRRSIGYMSDGLGLDRSVQDRELDDVKRDARKEQYNLDLIHSIDAVCKVITKYASEHIRSYGEPYIEKPSKLRDAAADANIELDANYNEYKLYSVHARMDGIYLRVGNTEMYRNGHDLYNTFGGNSFLICNADYTMYFGQIYTPPNTMPQIPRIMMREHDNVLYYTSNCYTPVLKFAVI